MFFYITFAYTNKRLVKAAITAFAPIVKGWPAPLYNLYFDSFLSICTSFVVRTRGIVCVVYLLFRLANYKDPCKRCVLDHCKHRAKHEICFEANLVEVKQMRSLRHLCYKFATRENPFFRPVLYISAREIEAT